jgi:hypothetical protein
MALNFLVTGVKILKKVMDKKKQKEAAKKFVGGDKEEKRAKISKIMDKDSSYGGKTKVKKPASISKSKLMKVDIDKVAKTTPNSAKIDYKAFTAKVDNIVGMTDALAFLTGAQSEQKKNELELLRQQREEEKKRKKEAKLEKKGGVGDKIKKGVKKAAQSPLDAMTKFLTNMALGALAMFLIANADKIRKVFETIGNNLNKFGKLLRVTIFGLQNGMKLAKAGLKMMGKGVNKVLSPIGKAFKAIGSKIKGVFKALGGKFLKLLKRIPGVKGLTNLIKGIGKTLTAAKTAVTATKTAVTKTVKKTVSKVAKPVTKAVSKVASKTTKVTSKVAGGVLKKGIVKTPGRLLIKLFGKNTAQMVANSGKLFKTLAKGAKAIKIPILGPIIVAITSILSGDNFEKTMFKTLGTAFGGMIGGGLGAALGGVGAPFGMLIGEIVGEFIGDFLYNLIRGDDDGTKGVAFLKKKFSQVLTGAGNAAKSVMNFAMSMLGKFGNFFKDGFDRFIEDFPTLDISKMRLGIGVASVGAPWALGKLVSLIPGDPFKDMKDSKGEINKIPDLGLLTPFGIHKLLPHLKNSFFPSGEKEQIPETSISGGGEGEEEVTAAKVETSDNNDDYTLEDVLDDAKKDAASSSETTTAELGEKDTSSTSSTVSDVSSKATYEESAAGTVVLTKPQRNDFVRGRTGQSKYEQAMIMYNNQKEVLNSYQKIQVETSLAKI